MCIIQTQQVSGDSGLAVVSMRINATLARSSGRDLVRAQVRFPSYLRLNDVGLSAVLNLSCS